MLRKIAVVASITSLTWSSAADAADVGCEGVKPEEAVYDISLKSNQQERLGTAFLVDWKRGLFLTAFHNLAEGVGPYILSHGGDVYEFDRVASGNNAGILSNDWALLKARNIDHTNGLFPALDVSLVYDSDSPMDFANTYVIGTGTSLRSIESVDWAGWDRSAGMCNADNTIMVEVPSYDRGYSGAPVYSKDFCGVSAISSRFSVPNNADTDAKKSLIRIFQKYTKASVGSAPGDEDRLDDLLTKQYGVIRELLKDKVFVRILPTKCVVEELVTASGTNTSPVRTQLFDDRRSGIKEVVDYIRQLNTDDARAVNNISAQISRSKWSWIELLQVSDTFYGKIFESEFSRGRFTTMLATEIANKQKAAHFLQIDPFYRGVALSKFATVEPSSVAPIRSSLDPQDVIKNFAENNSQWTTNALSPNLGLALTVPFAEDLAPGDRITAGLELAKLAEGVSSEGNLSEDEKSYARSAATAYLASGLSKWSDQSNAMLRGSALSQLSSLLNQEANVFPETGNLVLANGLDVELARAALNDLQDTPGLFRDAAAGRVIASEPLVGIGSNPDFSPMFAPPIGSFREGPFILRGLEVK